jgi:hypothetical protein
MYAVAEDDTESLIAEIPHVRTLGRSTLFAESHSNQTPSLQMEFPSDSGSSLLTGLGTTGAETRVSVAALSGCWQHVREDHNDCS